MKNKENFLDLAGPSQPGATSLSGPIEKSSSIYWPSIKIGERFLRPGGQVLCPFSSVLKKSGNARKNLACVSCAREGREGVGKMNEPPVPSRSFACGRETSIPTYICLRGTPKQRLSKPPRMRGIGAYGIGPGCFVPPPPIIPPRRFHAQGVEPLPGLP